VGKTDPIIFPWYKIHIKPKGDVALLGFTNNRHFDGDLYDRSLDNWDINSDWKLHKKYDTIICTRCAYFAKDPEDFIIRCYNSLNPNGKLYVDWGLGDHWRFSDYKIGWVKNEEHEHAYVAGNYLWSTVWDDSFLNNDQFKIFKKNVLKFGYEDVKSSVFDEVPSIVKLYFVEKHFQTSVHLKTAWEDLHQLYVLLCGEKL